MSLFAGHKCCNVIRESGLFLVGARREVAKGKCLRSNGRCDATIDTATTMLLHASARQEPP